MTRVSRYILIFFVFLFGLTLFHSCKSRGAHNKYRDAKVRVSEREMAKDKKIMRKAKKSYRKQMRKNRKHLFGRPTAPKA